MEYRKVQSASKYVETAGPELDRIVLETMKKIADAVGGTLGPGGRPCLIERFEFNLPPFPTKDGVTVFKSLGFRNPIAQCVMETARDASVRTASEAGDGTTTATILSEAIVRLTKEYCKANKRVSPQRVTRHLEKCFTAEIEPAIKALSRSVSLENDKELLRAVAQVSANGDSDLAKAVMQCFEEAGDAGNVTILEVPGPSSYQVERIQGFPVTVGYEESCNKFYPKFINDPGTQRCVLENPAFLIYNGRINEIQQLVLLMEQVSVAFQQPKQFGLDKPFTHNVVVVAMGFSESVLASLALNFADEKALNVFPLKVPNDSPQSNAQQEFLHDLSAVTGAQICDPISKPLVSAQLEDLGVGCELFESSRFRSTIVGFSDEGLLQARVEELEQQLKNPDSELDRLLLEERAAKLVGGIAKLSVVGPSEGDRKEKRDRAEDAVCAVRGALKYGVLPGGAWTLLKLCQLISDNDVNDKILRRAFETPFKRLLENSGIVLDTDEVGVVAGPILEGIKTDKPVVYDFLEQKHVDPYEGGILDSTPAVLEAVRNAIACAAIIGVLGAAVVFERDSDLERTEARATADFLRQANYNPADERP